MSGLTLAPEHAAELAKLWAEKEAEMGGRPDRAGECKVVPAAEAEAVVGLPGLIDEDDGPLPSDSVARGAELRRRFAAAVAARYKSGDVVTQRMAADAACVTIQDASKRIIRLRLDGQWPYRSGGSAAGWKRAEGRAR